MHLNNFILRDRTFIRTVVFRRGMGDGEGVEGFCGGHEIF